MYPVIMLIIIVLIIGSNCIKRINQSEVYVIERLGKYHKTAPPGITIIMPFVDRVFAVVTLLQQTLELPPQPVITQDNDTLILNLRIIYQIIDPQKAVYETTSVRYDIEHNAVDVARSVIGKMDSNTATTSCELINFKLQERLQDEINRLGVAINRVEVIKLSQKEKI